MKRLFALVTIVVAVNAVADRVPPGTEDEIRTRLAPAGEVCKVGDACAQAPTAAAAGDASGLGLTGEQIYNQFCFACHMAGVGGAPKTHNVDEWAPRLAKDAAERMQNMLNGLNAMPPKGTCMGCSEAELTAATEFMASAN